MTLKQANGLADAKALASAINDETRSHVAKGGILRNVAILLAALYVRFKDDSATKAKTLAKYADSIGVEVRDVPRNSFSMAVSLRLIGEGKDGSGTITEAHWNKASVHCLAAASKALNLIDAKQAAEPPELDADMAQGFRENVAAGIRANSEDDCKAQSDLLNAEKIAKDKEDKEAEAAKTPAQRILSAMQACGLAISKVEKLTVAEAEALASAAGDLLAIMNERKASVEAEALALAQKASAAREKRASKAAAETPAANTEAEAGTLAKAS